MGLQRGEGRLPLGKDGDPCRLCSAAKVACGHDPSAWRRSARNGTGPRQCRSVTRRHTAVCSRMSIHEVLRDLTVWPIKGAGPHAFRKTPAFSRTIVLSPPHNTRRFSSHGQTDRGRINICIIQVVSFPSFHHTSARRCPIHKGKPSAVAWPSMASIDVPSLYELLSALGRSEAAVVYFQTGCFPPNPGCHMEEVIRQLAAENSHAWFFRVSQMAI